MGEEVLFMTSVQTATIKAMCIHSFGGPELIHCEDVLPPEAHEGEALVRVHAAGVNPYDWKLCAGEFGPLPMPLIPGSDISGVVEALGEGVTEFYVGQPVFGRSSFSGGFAELAAVPVSGLAPKPPGLSDMEAAATPLAALTAWQALFDIANLRRDQRILINGGAGGVGSFAIQLAQRAGATVIATASAGNIPFLRLLGADQAIDYNVMQFDRAVRHVDVVLDLIGGLTQERSLPLVKPGGFLISTVTQPQIDQAMDRGVIALKMRTRSNGAQLGQIADLIAHGSLKVFVDKVFHLSEVGEALRLSRQGHSRGKIVVTIDRYACHYF
jgi:NADPH:quinone reductase-like Zn-dependent oxidoreductase